MKRGFTLIEVMVVLVVFGIMLMIVFPQFMGISANAKESALSTDCSALRSAIEFYAHQHGGVYPGVKDSASGNEVAGDAAAVTSFIDQLSKYSNSKGMTSATLDRTNYPLGPYLRRGLPLNPMNGKSTLNVIHSGENWPGAGDDGYGWVFDPKTGRMAPGCSGKDQNGTAYFDY